MAKMKKRMKNKKKSQMVISHPQLNQLKNDNNPTMTCILQVPTFKKMTPPPKLKII